MCHNCCMPRLASATRSDVHPRGQSKPASEHVRTYVGLGLCGGGFTHAIHVVRATLGAGKGIGCLCLRRKNGFVCAI
jgi:hypothetical protein